MFTQTPGSSRPLNLLVLYDGESAPLVNTGRDYLDSFRLFSRHRVFYSHAVFQTPLRFPLALFDAVLIHCSVRLPMRHHLASAYFRGLQDYQGLKTVFIQDEYENTGLACERITQLGIDVVFSCVPPRHARRVYASVPARVEFFPVLTGYLPLTRGPARPTRPLEQRPILIGYRGRPLPYHYGRLGQEKIQIARVMRAVCQAHGLTHDIEWAEQKRIYGGSWEDFIQSCRTMLGTESGSNVFDYDGTLRVRVWEALRRWPDMTFEEAQARFLQGKDSDGMMNQISPRIFEEAVALRTGLILFEGSYSGVIRPEEHYLPLRKDFRNVAEVLARARDLRFLHGMIDRAYEHVIGSGLYTYQRFIAGVEQVLEPCVQRKSFRPGPAAEVARTLEHLVESGALEQQACPKPRPPRQVELLRIAQLAVLEPRRSLPRLGWMGWSLLLRSLAIAPLRLLQRIGGALVWSVRLLPALLSAPRTRRVLGKGPALAGDLSRVLILRQAQRVGPQASGFTLVPRVQNRKEGLYLTFLSLPAGLGDTPALSRDERAALHRALRAETLAGIVWDHSAIGASLCYPFQRKLATRFQLGADGTYSFLALTRLAQRRPLLVLGLLRWVLAAFRGSVPKPHPGSSDELTPAA